MSYSEARERYAALGVDAEAALSRLKTVPVALHCWQGETCGASTPTRQSLSPAEYRPPAAIPGVPGRPMS